MDEKQKILTSDPVEAKVDLGVKVIRKQDKGLVPGFLVPVPWKSLVIEAVITRADGTVEKLGAVSRTHRNPIINLWWKIVDTKRRILKCLHY